MTTDTKEPNPKEAFGSAKVPLGLVPATAIIEMALALLEGALKYGGHNYRVAPVQAMTYVDAAQRHLIKYEYGQDRDPVTHVRELASVMACCAIIIDAELCGTLIDNRPPCAPVAQLLDANMTLVAHLKDLFKDHHPKQYTWEDTPGLVRETPPEPEGFPMGYSVESGPADANGEVDTLVIRGFQTPPAPAVSAVHQPQPLFLECGCTKRCKGHDASVSPAPAVEHRGYCTELGCTNERELYMVTCEAHRPRAAQVASAPGNYAAERAAPATQTHDAEFPHAPAAYTETKAFDPAD